MKHVKLFEDFDLDKFLQDPDAEFAKNEDNPELEPGDYVDTYRGHGQLLSIDGEFATVKFTGSNGTIAKVPVFALKKIKKSSVNTEMPDTSAEVKHLADQITNYVNVIEDDDLESEPAQINSRAALDFLEDILLDIISLQKKDPDTSRVDAYSDLMNGVSTIAYYAGQSDEESYNRSQQLLHEFQRIGEVRENQRRNFDRLRALGLASNNVIDLTTIQPEEKDIMRAQGLLIPTNILSQSRSFYGFDEGKASRMAQLIKDPLKMARRVKAVCQVLLNNVNNISSVQNNQEKKTRVISKLRWSFRDPMLRLGFTDSQIERMVDSMLDQEPVSEKRLAWHDSDAPDAHGKFKELGVNALADWLIKTRGKNLQKITGSLNQQINFNKKKNPSYAAKMEKTREAVKRKLGKLDESKKGLADLAKELVEIAASYTDVDLTVLMHKAPKFNTDDRILTFIDEIREVLKEEGTATGEISKFTKEANSFLKKHNIQ